MILKEMKEWDLGECLLSKQKQLETLYVNFLPSFPLSEPSITQALIHHFGSNP